MDNINMDLVEIRSGVVDWIDLPQDRKSGEPLWLQ
jgi:hypothetical protein